MKWFKVRLSIILIVVCLLSLGLALELDDFSMYHKKIIWTNRELHLARANVKIFRETVGRYPYSLAEIKQYAEQNPEANLKDRIFREYYSDSNGNTMEYDVLNGKGGWYYDKTSGEVRLNLTKPVKHYLKFYFGKKRNEIPSSW